MALPFIPNIPDITKILSTFFNIPPSYFEFPNIIFYFIIPFVTATYFWYVFLNYKFRIFRTPNVNKMLAFLIAFFNVILLIIFPPAWTTAGLVTLATLVRGYFSLKRIIIAIVVGGAILIVYPWLMNISANIVL